MNMRRQDGAMLMETLIVVSIVVALAAIAIPALSEIMLRKDMQNARENIMYSLKMARQIAQSENTRVKVTIENGHIQITPENSGVSREKALPSRVRINSLDDNQSVSLIFRPSGTATGSSNGQVIDSDTDLHIKLLPATENNAVTPETIRVGNYGNIASL